MRTRVRQGVDVDARTAVGDNIGAVARREAERPPSCRSGIRGVFSSHVAETRRARGTEL